MLHWRESPIFDSRDWRTLIPIAIFLIVIRSAVFVFWPQAYFDSDQAVHGLMAKHIAELRAFPVFMYGQSHLLAVEAWRPAPVFAIAGASVARLKLPLLALNIVVACLLIRMFSREVGLAPSMGVLAAIFFILPAPG